jgi:F0F1-type ATP synthase membrane subunit b/b'
MALGFVLGAWIYYAWFARYVERLLSLLGGALWAAAAPFFLLWRLFRRFVLGGVISYLQKKRAMIYNKHAEARRKRAAVRRAKNGTEAGKKKETIQAYAQD